VLILLSPAKIQNFKTPSPSVGFSLPVYLRQAETLVQELKSCTIKEIADLMQVNLKIAEQNADRFFNWSSPFSPDNAKQALWVYNGEVFHGLDAGSMNEREITYAQQHLRILSGLYGILRPLDLIQAYRLDVSHRLNTPDGNDLYQFWREKISKEVKKALLQSGKPKVLINLMSNEYFKAIDPSLINARIIDFEFLQYQPASDQFKPIVIYIKKARGLMARHIIRQEAEDLEQLKAFSDEGYWYHEQLSTANKLVFVR
jgi:cytoplasmic iron level regulating protein YaaA (DUF328/UPF0246 family)